MDDPQGGIGGAGPALLPVGERASSAIYGTILVTAVIVALSEDPAASDTELMEAAATSAVVFWLAHAYSGFIGRRAAVRDPGRWESFRVALALDFPMVQAAVPPLIALLLGAIDLLSRDHAVTAALVLGILELFVWGCLAARGSLIRSASIGLVNCLFGVAIILLKALIH